MPIRAGLRLLTFRVGELACAVPAAAVREVVPAQPATRVPGAAPPVTGLVHVRGSLLPLIDVPSALGYAPVDEPTIVVLSRDQRAVGLAVDEVLDLVTVVADQWVERGDLAGVDPRVVQAVGHRDGGSIVLLDVDALLAPLLEH